MEKVLISGGTGLVGSKITDLLIDSGYQVTILSRSKEGNEGNIHFKKWNPDDGVLDPEIVKNSDHIINLAGANLGDKRWTESYKQLIYDSRINSTQLLVNTVNETTNQLKTFINASGADYYEPKEGILNEDSPPGNDFLAKVCMDWENEVHKLKAPNVRIALLRMGVVLSPDGGALEQLVKPVKFGVGAPLGNGQQIMPWIHIDDIAQMYVHVLKNSEASGAFNAVAPEPVSNEAMTQTIAQILNKPYFMPKVPKIALKLMIGEFAETLLTSKNLSAEKIHSTGFQFQFPKLKGALENLLNND